MWNISISLPVSDKPIQDESGFVTHEKTYLEHIPANRKDTTRTDEVSAKQMGYTVSRIYAIDKACYTGNGYLVDEEDKKVYDIRRTHILEKSNLIELTCEVRQNGKI